MFFTICLHCDDDDDAVYFGDECDGGVITTVLCKNSTCNIKSCGGEDSAQLVDTSDGFNR